MKSLIRLMFALVLILFGLGALAANQSLLTWGAVTTRTDGTSLLNLAGYNIYRGASATTLIKLASVGPTVTTYTDLTPANGATYYYAATAFDATGLESAPSNIVSKAFPAALPSAPGNLTIAANTAFQAWHAPGGNFAMRKVGTAPASTPCDPSNAIICVGIPYYEIPVASVTWSKSPQPPPVYALCA